LLRQVTTYIHSGTKIAMSILLDSDSFAVGDNVKISRLMIAAALAAFSCSVVLADGATDPLVKTQGCGGKGQPLCDADFLTTDSPSELDGVTFTFLAGNDPTNPDQPNVAAFDDIVNWTGTNVGRFLVNLDPSATITNPDGSTSSIPLSYACGSPLEGSTGAFNCTQLSADSFMFDGATLCSIPLPNTPGGAKTAQSWLNSGQAPCQFGERFILEATANDNGGNPGGLVGGTVGANVFAPEPSSAFLLLTGLMAGVFGLRKRSTNLA
jgi:hypothetical protein